MRGDAARNVAWTMLSFGATKVLGVVTTILLARLLDPKDFGLVALASLGIGLLSIFNGNWLGATIIVRDNLDERAKGTVLTLLILSGALMAGTLAALAPVVAAAFDEPQLEPILFALAGILLISGVNWYYGLILQREFEFRRRFIVLVARAVATSAVSLALALDGAGVWSLVAGQIAGHLVNGAALLALAPYHIRPAFDRACVRDIVGGSRGFLGQELAEYFQQNADYIAVGQVLGPTQLGLYSMAYRQAELPHFAIADPVGTVTFPAFARMRHEGRSVREPFLKALRLVCLLTCPLGIIMSAGAHPFTEALFGEKWLPMTGVLSALGIWAIARPLQVTFGRLLNSVGAAWLYGRISVVGLAPFAAATVVAAHTGGIDAVAIVLLAYMSIIATLLVRVVSRHVDIPAAAQWAVLRPMLVASALSWAATRLTADATLDVPPPASLALTSVACLASYVAVLRLADPEVLRIAVREARRLRPSRRPAVAAS